MRKRVQILTGSLLALGLVGISSVPASAQTVNVNAASAVAVFVGSATVDNPSLWSPVSPNCTSGGLPTLCPSGSGGTWGFAADSNAANQAAVGLACGVLKTNDPGPPTTTEIKFFCTLGSGTGGTGVGAVTISASGSLDGGALGGAWCGASGGTGGTGSASVNGLNAEAVNGTPGGLTATRTASFSGVGWTQSAGSVIVVDEGTATSSVYGTSVTGPVRAVVSAVPTGGSCLAGTATTFTVVGVAAAVMTA